MQPCRYGMGSHVMAPVGLELLAAYRSALSRAEGLPEKQREAEGVRRQHLKSFHSSSIVAPTIGCLAGGGQASPTPGAYHQKRSGDAVSWNPSPFLLRSDRGIGGGGWAQRGEGSWSFHLPTPSSIHNTPTSSIHNKPPSGLVSCV